MASAFVLINTELGSESEVSDQLKKIDAVEESYMVYGCLLYTSDAADE